MWTVYILRCKDNSLYTGITKDLERRLAQHNDGKGAKYTRAKGPCVLEWSKPGYSESEAKSEEIRIKKLSAPNKQNYMDSKIGCPFDRDGEKTFSWSGTDTFLSIFFKSGYTIVETEIEMPEIDQRPLKELIRCKYCHRDWLVQYKWPDRPPCMANGEMQQKNK